MWVTEPDTVTVSVPVAVTVTVMVGGGGGVPPVPPPPPVLQAASLELGWVFHHLADPTGVEAEATVDRPMRQSPTMASIAITLFVTRIDPLRLGPTPPRFT